MSSVELDTLGAVIKTTYEGQPDTNPFTDAEKSLLAAIPPELAKTTYSVAAGIAGAIEIHSLLGISQANYDALSPAVKAAHTFLIFEA